MGVVIVINPQHQRGTPPEKRPISENTGGHLEGGIAYWFLVLRATKSPGERRVNGMKSCSLNWHG